MTTEQQPSGTSRAVALPVAEERLCMHFGHCQFFDVFEVDEASQRIVDTRRLEAPPHQPGLLPKWLHEQGVQVVIAGGMGGRARQLFEQFDIEVLVGAPVEVPRTVVESWLAGSLQTGENACDH